MPNIEIVDVMGRAPGECFVCHTTPTENGHPLKAIDLGTDHDWGQWTYLCAECVPVICELWGYVEPEVHEALQKEFEDLNRRHSKLRERFKKYESQVKKVLGGKKAERELRRKAA